MMNKSKKTAMTLYTERIFSNAMSNYQADSITSGSTEQQFYSVKTLMGQEDYYGCVTVEYDESRKAYNYMIFLYDANNKLKLEGYSANGKIEKDADEVVLNWASTDSFVESTYTDDTCDANDSSDYGVDLNNWGYNSATGANRLSKEIK